VDGSLDHHALSVIAGVANTGSDRDWSGSHFNQANWYAFGRFAWNPESSARDIAEEWTRMTFGNDPKLVAPVVDMMMGSREAAVDYMTPLGLAHLMGTGHHYGPAPWVNDQARADWNPTYYHRADANGIGFERGPKGSDATAQYQKDVAAIFADPKRTPEQFLLWFHHVPWDHRMKSGRILWDELVVHWSHGVEVVSQMRATWESLRPYVDPGRHSQVAAFLAIQQEEAQWWRDANIAYFQTFSKRPLPAGYAPPAHPLEYYQALRFPYAPGRG
jgi:alpha-glucuronidase